MGRIRKVKMWWQSRIIWVNAASGVFAFAAATWPVMQMHMTQTQWFLLGGLLSGINVALRFVTTDPVVLGEVRADERDESGLP